MLKKISLIKLNERQLQLMLFILFICIGSLYANLVISKNMEDYELIYNFFYNKMTNPTIIKTSLFEFLLFSRFKIIIGIWIVGFILFANYIDYLICCFFGFDFGLIFSAALMYNGFESFGLMLILICPQAIIYVPIFIYLIRKNIEFSKALYKNRKLTKSLKINGQLLIEYFLVLIICCVFTLIGITLEAYVNPDLIQWYISIKSF